MRKARRGLRSGRREKKQKTGALGSCNTEIRLHSHCKTMLIPRLGLGLDGRLTHTLLATADDGSSKYAIAPKHAGPSVFAHRVWAQTLHVRPIEVDRLGCKFGGVET